MTITHLLRQFYALIKNHTPETESDFLKVFDEFVGSRGLDSESSALFPFLREIVDELNTHGYASISPHLKVATSAGAINIIKQARNAVEGLTLKVAKELIVDQQATPSMPMFQIRALANVLWENDIPYTIYRREVPIEQA